MNIPMEIFKKLSALIAVQHTVYWQLVTVFCKSGLLCNITFIAQKIPLILPCTCTIVDSAKLIMMNQISFYDS